MAGRLKSWLGRWLACSEPEPSVPEPLEPVKRLGRGSFAEVWQCRDVETGKMWAVKLINRGFDDFNQTHFDYEVQCQALMHNNQVVELKQLFLTPQHLGLVLEHMRGGSLEGYFEQHGRPSEKEALFLFRQILSAVMFLHSHQIVHRDLKLGNLLVQKDPDSGFPVIKLADFGCARLWAPQQDLNEDCELSVVGTRDIVPPELVRASAFGNDHVRSNPFEVDVWELGILLVEMFCGRKALPYALDNYADITDVHLAKVERLKCMEKGKWKEEGVPKLRKAVKSMSPELVDLLDHMLHPKQVARLTLAEIQKHPWVAQELPADQTLFLEKLQNTSNEQSERPPRALVDKSTMERGVPEATTGRYRKVDEIVKAAARTGRRAAATPPGVTVVDFVPQEDSLSTQSVTSQGRIPSMRELALVLNRCSPVMSSVRGLEGLPAFLDKEP